MHKSKPKPPRRTRAGKRSKIPSLDGAYGMLLALMTFLIMARLVATAVAEMPPIASVGDRLALTPAWPGLHRAVVLPAHEMMTAFAAPGKACRLDTAEMAREGGVLTVMAVRPAGLVLSWAGGATSKVANCRAPSGEVMVPENDYAALLTSPTAKH